MTSPADPIRDPVPHPAAHADPRSLLGPDAPAARSWLIVLALLPGILLTLADATIMSVAIPLIIRRLESTVISVSWVMNGYNLVLTVLFLTMGRLADRYGHRRVFVAGLALFTVASLGCALAGSIDQLIAFRAVQAVGAAAVIPTALALMLDAFPAGRQGYAAGLFGALSSAAAALGPVLGGVLIERWGWPAIFWFNVPVGALGVALTLALVRGRPRRRTDARLDWLGVGLSSAGLFCLTLALIEGNEWGWTSPRLLALFAAAAALLALFVVWELRTPSPLFDLRLFRNRTFAAASGAIMTVDIAMMGTAFMLVIYMIAMLNYTELKAGLAVTTLPLTGLLLAPFAGRLVDRLGPRPLAVTGALLTAAGLFALGNLERSASLTDVLWRSALVGAGLGLSLPALTAAGMSVVPGGVKGVGSGVLNTARQLGFLLGVAILVAVFAHTMSTAVNRSADRAQDLTRAQTTLTPEVRDTIVAAIDDARDIDVSAGMTELRKIANPIANVIAPKVGMLEKFALLNLADRLEVIFWDEASAAFRWPFYTAAIAALIALIPGLLLPSRLPRSPE
jgi:EmrB/QacA subfamily drug resistance transporter